MNFYESSEGGCAKIYFAGCGLGLTRIPDARCIMKYIGCVSQLLKVTMAGVIIVSETGHSRTLKIAQCVICLYVCISCPKRASVQSELCIILLA